MDEIGFAIGTIQRSYVVVNKDLKIRYQAQPGRQEWISILECIYADEGSIPPFIILKGTKVTSSWVPTAALDLNWHFATSQKGWTLSRVTGLTGLGFTGSRGSPRIFQFRLVLLGVVPTSPSSLAINSTLTFLTLSFIHQSHQEDSHRWFIHLNSSIHNTHFTVLIARSNLQRPFRPNFAQVKIFHFFTPWNFA